MNVLIVGLSLLANSPLVSAFPVRKERSTNPELLSGSIKENITTSHGQEANNIFQSSPKPTSIQYKLTPSELVIDFQWENNMNYSSFLVTADIYSSECSFSINMFEKFNNLSFTLSFDSLPFFNMQIDLLTKTQVKFINGSQLFVYINKTFENTKDGSLHKGESECIPVKMTESLFNR